MHREELAETLFEEMNNERIEGQAYGSLWWEDLPTPHQEKYRRIADSIMAYARHNPLPYEPHAFEGVE